MTTSIAPSSGAPADAEGTGFCRVAVAAPTTRVDLALPVAVPVADLLPAIVGWAEQDPAAPHSWALSRIDGTRLDPGVGLAAAGVREGELLLLHAAREEVGDPLYDDVVEVLGDGVDETAWTTRDTRRAGGGVCAIAVLVAVGAAAAVGGLLAGVLVGVLALALLAGAVGLVRATGDVGAGTVPAVLAAAAGMVCGVMLLGPPFGAPHLLLACATALLVAVAAPPLLGGGDGVFLGIGLAATLTLVGAVLVLAVPASAARAAAVVAPLALALTTVMPTLALRLSRIPRPPLPSTATDLADVPGQLELDLVLHRVRRARLLLSGLLAGCYAVTGGGIVVLTRDLDSAWPCVLAAVLGLLLVMRARLFRRRAQVAAPLAAAAVAVAAGGSAAVTAWGGSPAILLGAVAPTALVLAALAGGLGLWGGRRTINPKLARGIDLVETTLLLAVVPIALAVWDVYRALLEIRA